MDPPPAVALHAMADAAGAQAEPAELAVLDQRVLPRGEGRNHLLARTRLTFRPNLGRNVSFVRHGRIVAAPALRVGDEGDDYQR